MRGIVSFHAVDPSFFGSFVTPLVSGADVGFDAYLEAAVRARRNAHQAGRWIQALQAIVDAAHPPPPAPILPRPRSARELVRSSVGLLRSPDVVLRGIKERLDRYDHRLDELSRVVITKIDPDLHLLGRPFLVTEASPKLAADAIDRYRAASSPLAVDNLAVEQLVALDAALAQVGPGEGAPISSDFEYRGEAFREAQVLSRLPRAAREGLGWLTPSGVRRPAGEVLKSELAWTAVRAHARIHPLWFAHDVDGLATVCAISGIPRPSFLATPEVLFGGDAARLFGGPLPGELDRTRAVGAYVGPALIRDLLDFLTTEGSRILRAASRFGESERAGSMLRKVRECATYAEKHGFGYLEASGITPVGRPELDQDPDE